VEIGPKRCIVIKSRRQDNLPSGMGGGEKKKDKGIGPNYPLRGRREWVCKLCWKELGLGLGHVSFLVKGVHFDRFGGGKGDGNGTLAYHGGGGANQIMNLRRSWCHNLPEWEKKETQAQKTKLKRQQRGS